MIERKAWYIIDSIFNKSKFEIFFSCATINAKQRYKKSKNLSNVNTFDESKTACV